MKYESVELKENYPFLAGGTLRIWCMDEPWSPWRKGVRPLAIVLPGGGYRGVSNCESDPIAAEFFAKGYQVAILRYLCCEQGVRYPEQLYELACAVDYVKRNAERLEVNPKEIFAVGFSAGGHLVADYTNECFTLEERMGMTFPPELAAVGLGYPVIDEHEDSFDNLLCGYPPEEKQTLKEFLKQTDRVSAKTAPTFLWTTAEDCTVPPSNTLRYALALDKAGVPYELHVYPKGGHGMANGALELNDNTEAAVVLSAWVKDMIRFFRSFCVEKY